MRDITLATIPHTGTNWVKRLFKQADPRYVLLNFDYSGPTHNLPHLYVGHVNEENAVNDILSRVWDTPLVMTMRHPYLVEESWKRREKDLDRLLGCYSAWFDHLIGYVDVYVPIDGSPLCQRVAEAALNMQAGTKFKYEWSVPIASEKRSNTSNLSLRDCEPSSMIREIRAHPVFTEFYGSQESEDEWLASASTIRGGGETGSDPKP